MSHAEERARRAAQRQLDAYNSREIDDFVAAYHPDVELFDLKTNELQGKGRQHLRDTYGPLFERCENLNASVTTRSVVGNVAVDFEYVTGLRPEPVHAMAIYEVDNDELITRVWFVIP